MTALKTTQSTKIARMATSKKRASALYTSKIIKAGALLADTQLLLAHWDLATSAQENLARIQQENLFGKASRARVADILAIFRQRYVADPHTLAALVALVRANVSSATLVPIYYFLAARADPLLRDAALQVIAPLAERGETAIRIEPMERWLQEQARAGRTQKAWSDPTITRIAQGLLTTLRDFGVLQGQLTSPHGSSRGILGLTTAHPASWASLTPSCRGPKPPPQASISAGPAVCGQDRTRRARAPFIPSPDGTPEGRGLLAQIDKYALPR